MLEELKKVRLSMYKMCDLEGFPGNAVFSYELNVGSPIESM